MTCFPHSLLAIKVDLLPTVPVGREVDLFPTVQAVCEVDVFPTVPGGYKVDLFPTGHRFYGQNDLRPESAKINLESQLCAKEI